MFNNGISYICGFVYNAIKFLYYCKEETVYLKVCEKKIVSYQLHDIKNL